MVLTVEGGTFILLLPEQRNTNIDQDGPVWFSFRVSGGAEKTEAVGPTGGTPPQLCLTAHIVGDVRGSGLKARGPRRT